MHLTLIIILMFHFYKEAWSKIKLIDANFASYAYIVFDSCNCSVMTNEFQFANHRYN